MNILVLDTETVGQKTERILDLAYKIVKVDMQKKRYETIATKNFIIGKIYRNKELLDNCPYMSESKKERYVDLVANRRIKNKSIKQALETLKKDIEKYCVSYAYAFNSPFDTRIIAQEEEKLNISPTFEIPVYDIREYACEYLATAEYIEYCKQHEFFTPTQRFISTTAETFSRYIYRNAEYAEAHTALMDVEDEIEILMNCVRKGCDITQKGSKIENMPSEKVFTESIIFTTEDGVEQRTFSYHNKRTKNGITTYYA